MPISRALLPSLVALSLTVNQPKWARFVSRPGGFTVLMPGRPTLQRASVPGASGPTRVDTWDLQLKNGAEFGVACADLPAAAVEQTPPGVLLGGARDGQLRNTRGKLLTEQNIALHGYPGIEATAKIVGGVSACRIFLVRRRLIQVVALTPNSSAYAKDRRRFLDSFRLLGD